MTPTIGREMADLHRKIADLLGERENLRDACADAHREVSTLRSKLTDALAEVEAQRASIVKLETEMWGWVEVCDQRDEARVRADKAEARVAELEAKMAGEEAP